MNKYKKWSGIYAPTSREELVEVILPMWQGRRQDVREMSVKSLREVYKRLCAEKMIEFAKRCNDARS